MTYYVCSLPQHGEPGEPKELFTDDLALAERFIEAEDKRPGRGVFQCLNELLPGARRRSLETVARLQFIYFDLDLQNIEATSRDDVITRLRGLPVEFIWVRDSGSGNLHVGIEIKDAPLRDTPEYDRVVAVWKRLAEKLAADPAPVHPAALIRCVGTHNKKNGGSGLCRPLWNGGGPLDITELEELDDLLAEPLLTRKFVSRDGTARVATGEHKGPVDIEVEFASMIDGASTNAAQTRIIPSLLRKGEHPGDVLELVVDRTMVQVGVRLGWTRETESKVVRSRIISAYGNLLLKDYDPATGVIPSWLPGAFHEVWIAKLQAGQCPTFGYNNSGFYVRKQQGAAGGAAKERMARPKGRPNETAKTAHKGRFKLVAFSDLQLGTDPLYLVDELIPIRGLVDVWGKAKCCKSFWTYDLCFHIAQGWEYRDRYVQQGAVVYCAFEGAHGYKKRKAALKQHYNIEEGARVPLYLVSETINLISEHSLLIAAITAQLDGTKPAVVVLDTLNKSLVGSENKDVDMGAYVRAAEAIRDAFDCVVIIVHHCGYDDTRPRGHSSLPAAVDAQLAVTRAENVVTVTVEMMRDGPEETQIVSEVVPVEVGMDRNGKVLTSLVVVPGSADAAAVRSDLPRGLAVFRSALIGALAGHGEVFQPEAGVLPVRAVNQWHIRDLFYATYAEAEEDEKKRQAKVQKAFVRALGDAQSRGMIRTLRTVDDARIMVWRPERQDGG